VLLVDDDPKTLAQLGRRLRREGYEVWPSPSFDRALATFKAGQVDAVIADWDLDPRTKKKGDALFDAIRRRDWEVPLILVSGKLGQEHEKADTLDRVMDCGAVQFVARGEGYDEIVRSLRELLARRDVALTELIRRLRATHGTIPTSSGRAGSAQVLKELLRDTRWKRGTLSPLAKEFAEWELERFAKARHS
jgi:DNA-binding response OmpR family regulator